MRHLAHWLKYQCEALSNTLVKISRYETLSTTSLQTRQSLGQFAYITTQVIAAPKLPYLHEWACRCGSEILRGQNLLRGLSNYTPSSVPLRSLHHYFLTHGCLCCFIFYGCKIMGEDRVVYFPLLLLLRSSSPIVVTNQCFSLSQGSLRCLNSQNLQSLQCKGQHRRTEVCAIHCRVSLVYCKSGGTLSLNWPPGGPKHWGVLYHKYWVSYSISLSYC